MYNNLYYYNLKYCIWVLVHMGEFLREINDKIPNFVGIKFTSQILEEGLEAVRAHNKKFVVFLGADTVRIIYFRFT